MLKPITLLFTLLIVIYIPFTSVLAAGGAGNEYPNYIDQDALFDIKLLKPLSANLNSDLTKNRINLVFLKDKNVETIEKDILQIFDVNDEYYLFGIEPFKSHKDVMNFWYLDVAVSSNTDTYKIESSLDWQGVKFASLVFLQDAAGATLNDKKEAPRSNADLPIIEYSPDFTTINNYSAGNVRLYYDEDKLNNTRNVSNRTFIHELGHSILGLRDEYVEVERAIYSNGYPNCAENEEQAKLWWGDSIGKIEPSFYTFRDELLQQSIDKDNALAVGDPGYKKQLFYVNGVLNENLYDIDLNNNGALKLVGTKVFDKNDILNEEDYKVKLNNKTGCYGGISYTPTALSIMSNSNLNYPSFGYSNVKVGNLILDIFKGDKPIDTETYVDYSNTFDERALSSADCKVVEKDNKYILDCYFKYQRTTTSNKVLIGYDLVEGSESNYQYENNPSIKNSCEWQKGVEEIYCTGLELNKYDPNKTYSIVFLQDINPLYTDQTPKQVLMNRNYSLTALNPKARSEYFFLLSDIYKPRMIEPVVKTPDVKPVSHNPAQIAMQNIISPQSTVRTAGVQYSFYLIFILSIILGVITKKLKQNQSL